MTAKLFFDETEQVLVMERYLNRRHWRKIQFTQLDMYEHEILSSGSVLTLFAAVAVQINSEKLF